MPVLARRLLRAVPLRRAHPGLQRDGVRGAQLGTADPCGLLARFALRCRPLPICNEILQQRFLILLCYRVRDQSNGLLHATQYPQDRVDQDGYAYDCWELCTKDTLKAVRFSPRKKMPSLRS